MNYCRQVLQSTVKYPPWTFPNTSKSTETYFSPASEDIANNITSVRTKTEVQQMFKLQIIINKSAWRRRHLQDWNPTLLQRSVRHVTPVTFLSVCHDGQITVVVVTGWWVLKHYFILIVWAGFLFICLTSVFKSIACRICQMPLIRQKTSRNLLSKRTRALWRKRRLQSIHSRESFLTGTAFEEYAI